MNLLTMTCAQAQTNSDSHFTIVLLGLAAVILFALVRMGVLSGGAFRHAPKRSGRMDQADLLVGVGLFFIGVFALSGLVMATFHDQLDDPTPRIMLLQMLIAQGGMLPAVIFALWRGDRATRGGIERFGLGVGRLWTSVRVTLLGGPAIIVLTMATMVLTYLLLVAVGYEPPKIAHDALSAMRDAPEGLVKWGLIGSAMILAPIIEEIIFRGFLQTALRQSGLIRARWGAIAVAGLLFTVIHFSGNSWHSLPALFVLSLGLGYAYERTGSLWPPIFIHAAFNTINIVFVLAGLVESS